MIRIFISMLCLKYFGYFDFAWHLLNIRYTNTHRLLDMHIDEFLNRKQLTSCSAAKLDAFLLASKKSLTAVAALIVLNGELDPFLIRITVWCLPSELRVVWMASLELPNECLTYKQLHNMLKAKVRAWENSEIGAKESISHIDRDGKIYIEASHCHSLLTGRRVSLANPLPLPTISAT